VAKGSVTNPQRPGGGTGLSLKDDQNEPGISNWRLVCDPKYPTHCITLLFLSVQLRVFYFSLLFELMNSEPKFPMIVFSSALYLKTPETFVNAKL